MTRIATSMICRPPPIASFRRAKLIPGFVRFKHGRERATAYVAAAHVVVLSVVAALEPQVARDGEEDQNQYDDDKRIHVCDLPE